MVEINNCPICGKDQFNEALKAIDHSVSKELFTITECISCGFQFTNPIPSEDEIGVYYKSEDYVSHSSTKKGVVNKIYLLVRKYTLRKKVKLVKKTAHGNAVLDIGAGTGHFVNACKNGGFDVLGLEPDKDARKFAQDNFNIILQDISNLKNLPDNSRDAITMWHVLEHVYHLKRDVADISRILKPNGVLLVAVPNRNSYDAQYYKEFWAAYDLPIHLYHFTPNDIHNLFDQFGFHVERILPMKFDSFYVSMLSEKYKGGNLFKAFFIGLRSNLRAKTGTYSSQIYILRPKTH